MLSLVQGAVRARGLLLVGAVVIGLGGICHAADPRPVYFGHGSSAAHPTTPPPPAAVDHTLVTYVLLGEDGARVARAITFAPRCPMIRIDAGQAPMSLRAPAGVMPQRPTRSDPALSKPSVFDALTCEAAIPDTAKRVSIGGRLLPLPPTRINRIVVIGDTGCRIKAADKAFQACNDPKAYPFYRVALAAAQWKPDLVVHVGDYLYRENACPKDQPGCANSPWGYGYDAWRADFFDPAAPLLAAAPWVVARGNQESCNRAGQGWWRFMDPRPLVAGRDCNDAANDDKGDYSDPYAVPLGHDAQLIVFDSSDATTKPLSPDDPAWAHYRDTYAKIDRLTQDAAHNILVDHHPMLAFAATTGKDGEVKLNPGNGSLQSAFASYNLQLFPSKVDFLLSGHIHVWEALSFQSPYPAQIVAGFSGTQEDIVPLPASPPPGATPAPGAVVEAMSSWVDGFGFMTLTREGPDHWLAQVHRASGTVVNTCQIRGTHLKCARGQLHLH
jgi:hypothetical protein